MRLSPALTDKVRRFPEVYLGVWVVRVVGADGRVWAGVEVAWNGDVIRVAGAGAIPFAEEDVVDVEDDSGLSD